MIVKSLIAGIVLAGMAGGGVYYGLSPTENERAAEYRVKPIVPKNVSVKKVAEAETHPHKQRKLKVDEKDDDKSAKSWIDQYVDKGIKDDELEKPAEQKNRKIIKTDIDNSEAVRDARARVNKMKAEAREAKKKAEAQLEKMRQETAKGEASGKFVVTTDEPVGLITTTGSFDTISVIMREAEKIESTDLRDRAYLNVVDYALMHDYFGAAQGALDEINQPELRETARSRIAVKYAGSGNPEAAFDLVDGVEMADFKDAMRIQIIEALIAAESLPNGAH